MLRVGVMSMLRPSRQCWPSPTGSAATWSAATWSAATW